MAADRDWFRRKTWTDEDRVDFLARLQRSRSEFHKAQYLRIQALELHRADRLQNARPSLELLDMLVERWPDESQLAAAHEQRAECLRDLGREEEAIDAYRSTFTQQRRLPQIVTNAHYEFAWWVASTGMAERFDEAMSILAEFSDDGGIAFPALTYLAEGSRALILDARGDRLSASAHARRAVAAFAQTNSELRHHPKVGLAQVRDGAAHARLTALAAR